MEQWKNKGAFYRMINNDEVPTSVPKSLCFCCVVFCLVSDLVFEQVPVDPWTFDLAKKEFEERKKIEFKP